MLNNNKKKISKIGLRKTGHGITWVVRKQNSCIDAFSSSDKMEQGGRQTKSEPTNICNHPSGGTSHHVQWHGKSWALSPLGLFSVTSLHLDVTKLQPSQMLPRQMFSHQPYICLYPSSSIHTSCETPLQNLGQKWHLGDKNRTCWTFTEQRNLSKQGLLFKVRNHYTRQYLLMFPQFCFFFPCYDLQQQPQALEFYLNFPLVGNTLVNLLLYAPSKEGQTVDRCLVHGAYERVSQLAILNNSGLHCSLIRLC